MRGLREQWQYWESEGLKSLVEQGLHEAAKHPLGRAALELVRGFDRIEDQRLNVSLAGVEMANPVMVGAGWDKKGRAVDALLYLGFGGVEVGSVLAFPQPGNPRPRMELDWTSGVARNALGFNASGQEMVADYLSGQARQGVVGINVGKNKLLPDEQAAWAHASVVERLYQFGDYFVINVSSPNTPGLRDFLGPEKEAELRKVIRQSKAVLAAKGSKPLFLKLTVDLDIQDVYRLLQLCAEEEVDGVIDTNTTINQKLKAKYGWADKPGGLSGNDAEYQAVADKRMSLIAGYVLEHELGLARIGVGGINSTETAIRRMGSGAQAVQVVTGLAATKLRAAEIIKEGTLDYMDSHGFDTVAELVGSRL